jgi:hypothetical protein
VQHRLQPRVVRQPQNEAYFGAAARMKLQHGLGYTAVGNRIQLGDACADLVEMYSRSARAFHSESLDSEKNLQAWRNVTATK